MVGIIWGSDPKNLHRHASYMFIPMSNIKISLVKSSILTSIRKLLGSVKTFPNVLFDLKIYSIEEK